MIQITKYLKEEYTEETTSKIKVRLSELNRLGFTEIAEGIFNFKEKHNLTIRDVVSTTDAAWRGFIGRISKGQLKSTNRTCFNCKFSTVCYAFKELKETLKYLPSNIDGSDAPMNQKDVFLALAGCCLIYEENN